MNHLPIVCGIALAALATQDAAAADHASDPYLVVPHTAEWVCAVNTSQIVQSDLKEAGLIDPTKVDDGKTTAKLLLKKSFGGGRYEQVYYLALHQSDGKSVSVIAESTTEAGECPASLVKTFVVSHELGQWPPLQWVAPPETSGPRARNGH